MGAAARVVVRRRAPVAGVGAVLAVLAVLSPALPGAAQQDVTPPVTAPPTPITWVDRPPADWPAPPPASARSYLLVDARTGQALVARAADRPRTVASLVKLLTVVTALETLSLDDQVVVGSAAVGGAGTSVDPGETWQVADLLDAVMVRSGNDAAWALAEAAGDGDVEAFVARLQATARDLGLDDAVVVDPTGLEDTNLLSARDVATIARVALADERIRASAGQAQVELPDIGRQDNRNRLLGRYEGATGLKTGFTDLAGYCLVASAVRDGRELVAVVLGAREDPARFEEAAALLDHGFEQLDSRGHEALRARHAGGWTTLLPAGRVWSPRDTAPTLVLEGQPDAFEVRVGADGAVLGTAAVAVPGPTTTSVGGVLAETVYAAMRRGHVAGAWPDPGGTDTTAAGSG